MEVSVRRTGTIIEVNYPELDLRFTASRIKADTDNCEVVIAWKMPYDTGMKSFYLRESTRLLDSWSKDKLIKSLEDRTQENPDRYNWGTIINEAFTKIIDKHREGYSAEVMDNLSEGNPRAYLVKPLLIEGVANLIWARGGSSKSILPCYFVYS